MTSVTIHKAKTELSKLIARVEAGEDIVIMRRDKAVAMLTSPKGQHALPRVFGSNPEFLSLSDDVLLAPLSDEELSSWEGRN